jgi:hypothetical protein
VSLGCHKPDDSARNVQMGASSSAAASRMDTRFEEVLIFWQDEYANRPSCRTLILARKSCMQDSASPNKATVLTG